MLTGTECRKTSIDLDQSFREGSFLEKIFWCPENVGSLQSDSSKALRRAFSFGLGSSPATGSNDSSTASSNVAGSRRATISLPPITLPSSSLQSIRLWLRPNESTSEINGCPACIHVNLSVRASLPVCPDKRTFPRSGRMRRIVRKRTVHRIWSFRLAKPRVRCLR